MARKSENEMHVMNLLGHTLDILREDLPDRGKKLLIVDDDRYLREATGLFLSENGYACTTVEDALKAITRLENDRFDLVITDLHMPKMDGMALLSWIKRRQPTTKVMMMTGDTDVEHKCTAMSQGAINYLVKPFNLAEFLQEVEGCLTTH